QKSHGSRHLAGGRPPGAAAERPRAPAQADYRVLVPAVPAQADTGRIARTTNLGASELLFPYGAVDHSYGRTDGRANQRRTFLNGLTTTSAYTHASLYGSAAAHCSAACSDSNSATTRLPVKPAVPGRCCRSPDGDPRVSGVLRSSAAPGVPGEPGA